MHAWNRTHARRIGYSRHSHHGAHRVAKDPSRKPTNTYRAGNETIQRIADSRYRETTQRPLGLTSRQQQTDSCRFPWYLVFCFVAVHRAQCPTRWGRPTKEIKNATDTQKRRKRQGRRAGEMLHRQCRGMQLSTCLQVQPGLAAMRVMQMMFGTCNLGAREVD